MMEDIIDLLHSGGYSCVIFNQGQTRTFTQRGVADLFGLLRHEPELLKGALIADKVVGKAAASLMILGGVKELFTDVISQPALDLFGQSAVIVNYTTKVPYIINRTGTDWCPLEKLCLPVPSAEEALLQIEEFVKSLNNKK